MSSDSACAQTAEELTQHQGSDSTTAQTAQMTQIAHEIRQHKGSDSPWTQTLDVLRQHKCERIKGSDTAWTQTLLSLYALQSGVWSQM